MDTSVVSDTSQSAYNSEHLSEHVPGKWGVLPPDVDTLPNGARRCKAMAHDRDEEGEKLPSRHRCMSPAIIGATICRQHGGAAPQVRQKARLNLLELVNPAIATLGREMATAAKSSDRLRAAENVLDRAGFPRSATFDVQESKHLLVSRLIAMRDEAFMSDDELIDGDETAGILGLGE